MSVKLHNVLVADPVHENCIQILQQFGINVTHGLKLTPQQLCEIIPEYDGLIVRSETKVTREVLEAGRSRLKLVGRAGTGVDNIDVAAATQLGIYVLNTPGGNSLSACELTCALISALARKVGGGVVSMKEGRWDRKQFMGTELYGKTLGVIGLGRIGREVASRMKSYGMSVVGFDPLVSEHQAAEMGVQLLSDLDKMWPSVDYITLHVPLNRHTKDLVDARTLDKCKRGVRIVNVARGGIVNETHLLQALNSGQCGGAGLDVYTEEPPKSQHIWDLIKHPLVIPTPHLGASTEEAQIRVAEEIAQQFVALAEPKSGFTVCGVLNSDVLAASSQQSNIALANLSRILGSLASSVVPLSDRPSVHVHTVSEIESRWVVGCSEEGLTGLTGPACKEEAKKRGLQEITYSHTKQPGKTNLSLTISSGSTKHNITGAVNGDSGYLVSVDDACFNPVFTISSSAKLISTSAIPPSQAVAQLFNEVKDVTSIGMAKSSSKTWICFN